jgi:hypothetical protein
VRRLREEVEAGDARHDEAALHELGQIPREGRGIARDVHHAARLDPREIPTRARPDAAARGVEHDDFRLYALRGRVREHDLALRLDDAHVPQRGRAQVPREIGHRARIRLHRRQAREAPRERQREEAGAGEELERLLARAGRLHHVARQCFEQQRVRLREAARRDLDALAEHLERDRRSVLRRGQRRRAGRAVAAERQLPLAVGEVRARGQRAECGVEGRHEQRTPRDRTRLVRAAAAKADEAALREQARATPIGVRLRRRDHLDRARFDSADARERVREDRALASACGYATCCQAQPHTPKTGHGGSTRVAPGSTTASISARAETRAPSTARTQTRSPGAEGTKTTRPARRGRRPPRPLRGSRS